jgi:hypothetical protein
MRSNRPFAFLAAAWLLAACQEQSTSAVVIPDLPCDDADSLVLPRFSVTAHHKDTLLPPAVAATLPNTQWAKGDSVRAFFGGKDAKLVFTLDRDMYLVTYGAAAGEAEVSRISRGDEGLGLTPGSINSPLFSPDGKKIVFAGTTRGKPGFILDAVGAGLPARRVMLDQKGANRTRVTADPHWVQEGDRTFIYFSTLAGLVNYSDHCGQIPGGTYKVEVNPDGSVDSAFRITGIPGAYRGGFSKDLKWAGTSYATSALYNTVDKATIVLAGGEQQCNPSMNPYAPGSRHSDYMLILAFGGKPMYHLITGDSIEEGLHENLWIYNKDNKIVWQCKRPDEQIYERFDKPEWSTHPGYATAIVLRKADGIGDLYVIKIGDLADAEEGKLNQAQGYLKIGSGGFTSDSYSHLWVAP